MIDLWEFRGMRWQVDDFKLGHQYATIAHNLWLNSGSLDPMCDAATWNTDCDYSNTKSLYRHEDKLIRSDLQLQWAKSLTNRDYFERLYYIGDNGCLRFWENDEISETDCDFNRGGHLVGIRPPDPVPYVPVTPGIADWNPDFSPTNANLPLIGMNVSNSNWTANPANPLLEKRYETSFVFTYVNKWGEESEPSWPTYLVPFDDGDFIQLTPIPRSTDPDVIGVRVYMAINNDYYRISAPEKTHDAGGRYEVPNLTIDYAAPATFPTGNPAIYPSAYDQLRFAIDRERALDELITEDWTPPPCRAVTGVQNNPNQQSMLHLEELQNGMMVMADENTLYFNEPYQAHAWPIRYRRKINSTIRAIKRIDGGFVVLTDDHPRVFLGFSPDAMNEIELHFHHAVSDPQGVARLDNGVVYPCQEGLAFVSANNAYIINDGIIDRKTWLRHVTPETCRINVYEGRIIILTELPDGDPETLKIPNEGISDNRQVGYVYNVQQGEITSFDAGNFNMLLGLWRDSETNDLILGRGNELVSFMEGTPMMYRWRSGKIQVPHARNLNATRMEAEGFPVLTELRAEERIFPKVYKDNRVTRTPATGRKHWVQMEVVHNQRVSNWQWAIDLINIR